MFSIHILGRVLFTTVENFVLVRTVCVFHSKGQFLFALVAGALPVFILSFGVFFPAAACVTESYWI